MQAQHYDAIQVSCSRVSINPRKNVFCVLQQILEYQDLQHCDFEYQDLDHYNFEYQDLNHCGFENQDLDHCDLMQKIRIVTKVNPYNFTAKPV